MAIACVLVKPAYPAGAWVEQEVPLRLSCNLDNAKVFQSKEEALYGAKLVGGRVIVHELRSCRRELVNTRNQSRAMSVGELARVGH